MDDKLRGDLEIQGYSGYHGSPYPSTLRQVRPPLTSGHAKHDVILATMQQPPHLHASWQTSVARIGFKRNILTIHV
jgi:hypothetical protein